MGAGKWVVVLFMFMAAFGGMTVLSPVYTFTFIPIVCFGAMLIGKPRLFIYIFISISSVYPLIQTITAFAPFQYLNEIMALMLYIIFFGHLLLRRTNLSGVENFSRLCFLFFAYCLLVWAINMGIPKGLAQFFFVYLPFIPLFFLVREYFTERDFGVLFKWTIIFFWVNFLLNMGWWFRINPLPNWQADRGNMVDHALGTMNGQTMVAYFCGMLIFLLLAALIKPELFSVRQRRVQKFTLIAVLIQFFMTFTNHAYVFFAVALVAFVWISKLWKKWYVMMGLITSIILFGFVVSQSEMFSIYLNQDALRERYVGLKYSPKVLLYQRLLVDNLRANPNEWLFGVGPGNGMGNIGKDNYTEFAVRMLLEFYTAADESKMQITSITGSTNSAVFSIWGDVGLIGFILFIWIYALAIIYCFRKMKRGGREALVGQFLIASFIFWGIISLVFDAMTTVIPLWLWAWMGWVLRKESGNTPSEQIALEEHKEKLNIQGGRG